MEQQSSHLQFNTRLTKNKKGPFLPLLPCNSAQWWRKCNLSNVTLIVYHLIDGVFIRSNLQWSFCSKSDILRHSRYQDSMTIFVWNQTHFLHEIKKWWDDEAIAAGQEFPENNKMTTSRDLERTLEASITASKKEDEREEDTQYPINSFYSLNCGH